MFYILIHKYKVYKNYNILKILEFVKNTILTLSYLWGLAPTNNLLVIIIFLLYTLNFIKF